MKHFKLMKGVLACLLSLVLVASSIAPTNEISAADTTTTTTVVMPTEVGVSYDCDTNSVKPDAKAVIYVVKKATGNDIKAGAKCTSVAAGKTVSLTDLGVKGTNKDVYLYVCNKEFEAAGKGISANLVIKAQAAKKVTVNVDYTQADTAASAKVLSATAVDSSKKAIEAENIKLKWSSDGATKWDDASTFKGADLAKMLKAGGGLIYVKMVGKSGSGTSGDAQFSSKAVKVKIAKPAKAPSVKMDVKKDTIALKNGFDFAVATETSKKGQYTVAEGSWFTVLPVLKTAATKTAEKSIVETSKFAPVSKKSTDANKELEEGVADSKVSYTAYKFKAVDFDTILKKLNKPNTEDFVLAVRKSATEKKPASDVSYYKVSGQTLSPIVLTESKVDGQYLITSGTDFAKKGIALGSVIAYPGTTDENKSKLATTGFDSSFKVEKAKNKDADENGANFEYCIVKTENLYIGSSEEDKANAVDMSTASWKKFDPAKMKFSAKTKSKYNTIGGTKVEATLAATDKPETGFDPSAIAGGGQAPEGTVILIRRAGVKGKTVEDAKRNSEFTVVYVVKDEKGNYEFYGTQDIGDPAWKYTVKFAKYNAEENKYYVDDSLTQSVWVKDTDTSKKVEIPKAGKFEYFEVTAMSGDECKTIGTTSLSADSTDKKYYSTSETVTSGFSGESTKVYAIKEYANVTVVFNYETSDEKALQSDTITIKDGVSSVSGVTTKYFVGEDSSVAIDYSKLFTDNVTKKKFENYKVSSVSGEGLDGVTVTFSDSTKTIAYKAKVVPSAAEVKIELTVKLDCVTITLDSNGGTGSREVKLAKGGTLAAADYAQGTTFKGPEGKTVLKGWNTDANANVGLDLTTKTFDSDTTLYAIWSDK